MRYFLKLMVGFCMLVMAGSASATIGNKANGYSVPVLRPAAALNSSLGVRSFGMGEGQTGRPDDLSAMYYNPAGLSLMGYWEWAFDHKELANDVDGDSLLISAPLSYGQIGFQGSYYSVRDNQHIHNGGINHPDFNKETYAMGLTYGLPLYRKFIHFGLTTKWISSDFLSNENGATIDFPTQERALLFDTGLIFTYDLADLRGFFFYFPQVSLGLAARNLQPSFGFDYELEEDAREFNAGLNLYYNYKFMLAFDARNRVNEATRFSTGIEIWPVYFLALRGGVTSEGPGRVYRSYYWGAGFGASVGKSKMSIEYAGLRETTLGESFPEEYFHRIAIHQNFEKVTTVTGPYGKERDIRLAQSDRYNSPLQFAVTQDPEEIVDQSVLMALAQQQEDEELVNDDTTGTVGGTTAGTTTGTTAGTTTGTTVGTTTGGGGETTTGGGGETGGGTTGEPVVIVAPKPKKKTVGLFPFAVEFAGDEEGKATELPKQLRRPMIRGMKTDKRLKPLREIRYKLTPRREDGEEEFTYLNRLCQFHRADLLAFGTLLYDPGTGKVTLKIVFHKKGAKRFTAEAVVEGSDQNIEDLKNNATQDFLLQVIGTLNLEKA